MEYRIDIIGQNVMNNLSLKNWEVRSFEFNHNCDNGKATNEPETTVRITGTIFSDSNGIQDMFKNIIDNKNNFLNFSLSSLSNLSKLGTFAGNLYNSNRSNTLKLFNWSKHWGNNDYYRNLKVTVKLSESNIKKKNIKKMICDFYQESFDMSGNGYFVLVLKQSKFSVENNKLEVNSFGL